MQTVKFYTLGCKVNQYDAQAMRESLLKTGLKELSGAGSADVYVINTCTVTARSDSESLSLVRKAFRENPAGKVLVAGCLAELDAGRIKEINNKALIVKGKDKERLIKNSVISGFQGHTRAFLKIQDGCDNFCAYCKVPLVRGRSRSKSLERILREANSLVKSGFKEIVLTGICLGAYGRDLKPKSGLAKVIGELEKIEGLLRIRLSSIEAGDISEALIRKLAASKKACRHLHIPIQSGDDTVLQKMRRRYTRKDYLALIARLKKCMPKIAITTDVLVGFPGESDSNFRNTVGLVKRISPLKVHIFPYSRREGTIAASQADQEVPVHIIKERICELKKAASVCAMDYKKRYLGKKMEVLFEEEIKDAPGWWQGHTDNYILSRFRSGQDLKNKLLKVPVDFR